MRLTHLSCLAALVLAACGEAATPPSVTVEKPHPVTDWKAGAMVAAANPMAVEAGLEVLRKGGSLLLSSLARHEHEAAVQAYSHVNLGFSDKELRKFAEKAGLQVSNLGTVTRERRPPHFEVISLIGIKP